jgi:hypothetical protein
MDGSLFQVRFVPIQAAFFSGARISFCLHSKPFFLVVFTGVSATGLPTFVSPLLILSVAIAPKKLR